MISGTTEVSLLFLNTMKPQRYAAHYCLVRLLPQMDAGELANIGVLLVCPGLQFADFKLARKYSRFTRFFEEVSPELYVKLRKETEAQLRHLVNQLMAKPSALWLDALDDLARPSEAIVQFSDRRTLLVEQPGVGLTALVSRYVQREYAASKQYREELLTRALRRTLARANLNEVFEPVELGTEDFHVKLPLVHERDGRALAAIKPLDLAQEETLKIYEHGDLWVQRLRRLQRMNRLPEQVLIAADAPEQEGARLRAYEDIAGELRNLNIQVVKPDENNLIVKFAQQYVH